jgi:3-dehydroquinate synthase
LEATGADRILKLLRRLGFAIFAGRLLGKDSRGDYQILAGLEEFREHLGGELTITLLKEIGSGVEVHEMVPEKIVASIQELELLAKT